MYIILLIMVLVSIAFVTLLERKILGYAQIRRGPNKVSVLGLFQPFADGLKLLSKENFYMNINSVVFFLSPLLMFFSMLLMWISFESKNESILEFSMVYVMMLSGFGVYYLLGAGWSTNSKYGMLGAYRALAQTVSYEVSFSFIVMMVFFTVNNYMFMNLNNFQEKFIKLIFGSLVLMFLWMVIILAETNRSPFDFAESESELVSGFNIEFGSGLFTFLFLGEYGMILFMSLLTSIMFFGGSVMFLMLILFFILLIRGTYVRFRYDNLMYLAWKVILPSSIIMYYGYICFLWIKFSNKIMGQP